MAILSSHIVKKSAIETIISQAKMLGIPHDRPAIMVFKLGVKCGFLSPIFTELKNHAAPDGSSKINLGFCLPDLMKLENIEAAKEPTPA